MANEKDISVDQKRKIARKFLVHIGRDPDTITKRCVDRLMTFKYKELIRPMVISERTEKDTSRSVLARKYRVSVGTIKWICNNYM